MLGILRRVFSFSDWQVSHPKDPPPGDMLDASFNAQDNKISELEQTLSHILRSDGLLQNERCTTISAHAIHHSEKRRRTEDERMRAECEQHCTEKSKQSNDHEGPTTTDTVGQQRHEQRCQRCSGKPGADDDADGARVEPEFREIDTEQHADHARRERSYKRRQV